MKLKITNKKKFLKSMGIIIGIALTFLLFTCSKSLSHANIKYSFIYVKQGETLWTIAENEQRNNPYYTGKDIRYIIYNIKNINNLTSSYLYEGQELLIANT